ncbi:MAG: zinc-ribbon domain-containing protein [Ruminococcaceae bacterium]|nr:zinc-ribbon domain-containing protein [Oscillospiraceae bacterium]
MKYCQKCGNEMDDKVILCVKCGTPVKQQKQFYKKWWFWVIIAVVVIIGASASGGEEGKDNTNSSTTQSTVNSSSVQSQTSSKEEIVYKKVKLQDMMDLLEENALKAEKTYQDKFIEVTGEIKNFDSDGKYISIEPVNADDWNFKTATCNIENDKQRDFLLEKKVGDKITIKGEVISIGEVLGYTIDIDEVK